MREPADGPVPGGPDGLAGRKPGSQPRHQRVDTDALLGHRVALAHGDGLVLEGIEVHGHAERGADFVLPAVAPPDRLRNVEATSLAFGVRSALRDSGSTATFTGANRGSKRSTVRLSTPPFEFGASSSSYASSMNASTARVRPAAGSITYGVQRSSIS